MISVPSIRQTWNQRFSSWSLDFLAEEERDPSWQKKGPQAMMGRP